MPVTLQVQLEWAPPQSTISVSYATAKEHS